MLSNLMLLFVPLTMAALNTTVNRGSEVVQISTNGVSEICVIPKKYPNAKYSEKDIKKEQELCSLAGTMPAALCPKMASTNPGVEFFSIPDGMTRAQVEAKACNVDGAKKLAKYKGSTSCSYTPALLGYYHVSRILGNVLQVPPAVVRTMDLENHKKIAEKALTIVKDSLLRQTWTGYYNLMKAGSTGAKRDLVLTSDYKHTYGALQQNPRDEAKYSEMFFGGSDTQERAVRYGARSPIYALLKDKRDLSALVSNKFTAENVQKVQLMKENADLIVMDTVLNQHDRFGNIHYTPEYVYMDSSNGMNVKSQSKMTPEEIRQTGAVAIKRMMLKDNDCGVSKGDVVKGAKLANGLSHLSQETYTRLVQLEKEVANDSAKSFFKEETLMTDADYASIKTNITQLVQMLKKSCQAGTLKLDLDLEAHFAGKPLSQSCE